MHFKRRLPVSYATHGIIKNRVFHNPASASSANTHTYKNRKKSLLIGWMATDKIPTYIKEKHITHANSFFNTRVQRIRVKHRENLRTKYKNCEAHKCKKKTQNVAFIFYYEGYY